MYAKILVVLAVLFIITACENIHTLYAVENYIYQSPKYSDRFQYKKIKLDFSRAPLVQSKHIYYNIQWLQFPTDSINGQPNNIFKASYFKSKLPGKKKLVIILPIWGIYTYPSNVIADGILKRSKGKTNVILVHGDNRLVDWGGMQQAHTMTAFRQSLIRTAKYTQSTVIDVRRLIDWAQTQQDVDSKHIGVIGFSISAVVAATLLGHEPRLSAAVLVMGGTDNAETMTYCRGISVETRDRVMKRFGWSISRYQTELTNYFYWTDPGGSTTQIDPNKILMFDSYYDDCISKHARETLWRVMGKPERYSMLYNHYYSFVSMTPLGFNFMRIKIYEFLGKNL